MQKLENALSRNDMRDAEIITTAQGDILHRDASDRNASFPELRIYYQLIRKVLSLLDACKSDFEEDRYDWIRGAVWGGGLHIKEIKKFDTELIQSLKPDFPDLAPDKYVFPCLGWQHYRTLILRRIGSLKWKPELNWSKLKCPTPGSFLRSFRSNVSERNRPFRRRIKSRITTEILVGNDRLVAEMDSLVLEWTTLDKRELEFTIWNKNLEYNSVIFLAISNYTPTAMKICWPLRWTTVTTRASKLTTEVTAVSSGSRRLIFFA